MALLFDSVETAPSQEYTVLKKVSLEAPFRRVTGLFGQERDGHLEALRVAAGLLPIRSGSVTLDGIDISQEKPDSRPVRLIFWNQTHRTGKSVSDAMLETKAITDSEAEGRLLSVGLSDRAYDDVDKLSAEDRFMLHIAQVLLSSPQVLLFEESFLLFSKPVAFRLIRRLKRLVRQSACAFVYASSDMETMRAFADTYYIFSKGTLVGS